LLLAVCLAADGPLFEDALSPPQDVFYVDGHGKLNEPEHLTQNRVMFAGFLMLQGILVFAVLRLRQTAPLQTSTLQLQATKRRDSENGAES
jgi:hypothetical protein